MPYRVLRPFDFWAVGDLIPDDYYTASGNPADLLRNGYMAKLAEGNSHPQLLNDGGLPPIVVSYLADAGLETYQDALDHPDLSQIYGIGAARARAILEHIRAQMGGD